MTIELENLNIVETSRLANILHQLHKILQHVTNPMEIICSRPVPFINYSNESRAGVACSSTYARQRLERDRTPGNNRRNLTANTGVRDCCHFTASDRTMIPAELSITDSDVMDTVNSHNTHSVKSSAYNCENPHRKVVATFDETNTKRTAYSSIYIKTRNFSAKSEGSSKRRFGTTKDLSANSSIFRKLLLLTILTILHSSLTFAVSLSRDTDIEWATSDVKDSTESTVMDELIWPLADVAPTSITMSSRKRTERAAKRGVPPKFLIRHTLLQRLYARNSYFLEILKNGKVRGTLNQNSSYNVVRLESIAAGVLAIYGTKSQRYLAMNRKGNLYGSKTFTDECKFYEKMESGLYFTYEAVPTSAKRRKRKRSRVVGFDKNGKAKKGHRMKASNKGALFTKLVVPTKRKNRRRG
uniref:uncharacterized protein LOC120342725 n=1 Tax=Styela clava TaxID=7725 RepID=UPI00193A32A2|nr:uncharacterized protein LOC120342725 [Styela clava]